MKRILLLALLLTGLLTAASAQSVAVFIQLYGLYSDDGHTLLPGDHMLQFVDLGANGVFDPVSSGSWTGGDDHLVTLPYFNNQNVSQAGEWPSAAAVDSWPGLNGDAGTSEQVFPFTSLSNAVYGIRWWSEYRPADYYAGQLPHAGDLYGQFTRVGEPLHGAEPWVINGDGTYIFDALGTASFGGLDPESAGYAAFTVAVPEPATAALLVGVFTVSVALCLRRRRA